MGAYEYTPAPITPAQKRCIYTLARRELNISDEDIHAMTFYLGGVEHVSELTAKQAKSMIDMLKDMAGQDANVTRRGKPTPRQIELINSISCEMGWNDDRLRAFIEKRFRISHVKFLDDKTAVKVIEALKAIKAGNRGERRHTGDDRNTSMVT